MEDNADETRGPGRPALAPGLLRSSYVRCKVTDTEKAIHKEIAAIDGLSVATWLRRLAAQRCAAFGIALTDAGEIDHFAAIEHLSKASP